MLDSACHSEGWGSLAGSPNEVIHEDYATEPLLMPSSMSTLDGTSDSPLEFMSKEKEVVPF